VGPWTDLDTLARSGAVDAYSVIASGPTMSFGDQCQVCLKPLGDLPGP
jgi:hypothetical protein